MRKRVNWYFCKTMCVWYKPWLTLYIANFFLIWLTGFDVLIERIGYCSTNVVSVYEIFRSTIRSRAQSCFCFYPLKQTYTHNCFCYLLCFALNRLHKCLNGITVVRPCSGHFSIFLNVALVDFVSFHHKWQYHLLCMWASAVYLKINYRL